MDIYIKFLLIIIISLIVGCANTSNNINETLNYHAKYVRTDEDIQLSFQRNKGEFNSVYNNARVHDQFEIIYRISVNPDGKVVKSEVIKSKAENIKLEQDINEIILNMEFNKVTNQEIYTFDFPLVFFPK